MSPLLFRNLYPPAFDGSDQQKALEKHASVLEPRSMVPVPRGSPGEKLQTRVDAALHVRRKSLLDGISKIVMKREVQERTVDALAKVAQARVEHKLQFLRDGNFHA